MDALTLHFLEQFECKQMYDKPATTLTVLLEWHPLVHSCILN